jgi:hypothetical protein
MCKLVNASQPLGLQEEVEMKKSILAAFVATALVFGGSSVALAAGHAKVDKVACASAKAAHKAAVTKVDKKATLKVVNSVCKKAKHKK